MRQRIGDHSIICSEIHKNFNTPENIFRHHIIVYRFLLH